MSARVPTVLILGHSFVKRLQRDLKSNFDPRVDSNFKLQGTASVYLHGDGGHTVYCIGAQQASFKICSTDLCLGGMKGRNIKSCKNEWHESMHPSSE